MHGADVEALASHLAATWAFCTGRKTLAQAAATTAAIRETAAAIADRARMAFAAG
jgi:hypothetical protein